MAFERVPLHKDKIKSRVRTIIELVLGWSTSGRNGVGAVGKEDKV